MTNQPTNQQVNDQDIADQDDDNTPIEESQRHTGMEVKSDEEAQPESSSSTGPEGAPNQGTGKR